MNSAFEPESHAAETLDDAELDSVHGGSFWPEWQPTPRSLLPIRLPPPYWSDPRVPVARLW
jgi:hypothetical protein